eukprot:Skav206789  [mRNA]  locus=scaffold1990:46374:51998:- [translate_table: standard]
MKLLALCLTFAAARRSITAIRTSGAEESNETHGECKHCELVTLDKSLSLSWSIFPPNPIPGYSMSLYCAPSESVSWDADDPEVEAALGEGCGLEGDELSSSDQKKCKEQSATAEKRAAWERSAHEEPLMACTARTYQRIMQNALSEQWWPLMHNAEGTFGSIDLGYDYNELMKSLRCASKESCLEKGLDHLGKEDLKKILENNTAKEAE